MNIRNEHGLIEGVNYVKNADGTINWRKMVKPEFLISKTGNTDVANQKDEDLYISLAGLKELAALRGYENVTYVVPFANPDYVVVACTITWMANFETGNTISFSSLADASLKNTEGFATDFLAAIAENRAFARCVRNFLKIHVCALDETKDVVLPETQSSSKINLSSSLVQLDELMREKGFNFEKIKDRLLKEGMTQAVDFKSLKDIPGPKVLELLSVLKKIKPKKD